MGGVICYGRYTKDQVERANQIDLEELLRRNGENLLPSGREKRLENDHSVTVRGNQWFDLPSYISLHPEGWQEHSVGGETNYGQNDFFTTPRMGCWRR